ncbi:MAG: methylaspartate mutase subunit E [Eubacteriales bacterium]|nr:methylaspartate mutase subunit E [Eubacteriales bacterium]
MGLQNKKIEREEFDKIRKDVLTMWPTGKDVENLEDGFQYQKSITGDKRFTDKLNKAKEEGQTLIQPRAGVALIDEHIVLLKHLEEFGKADLLPSTIDAYTRLCAFKEAENGINASMKEGRSLLNGFPAVNHGVKGCRKVIEALNTPIQVRHGTPDARLLCEITLAGGFTSFEGGGVSYNLPYAKNIPMEKTIIDWQYIDRLTGIYEENGCTINREPFGPLTGTLVPPSMSHAVAVTESILAATQGVKNITVGYGQCGNLIQDVASIRALEEITNEYLIKLGFKDINVTTVLHQWMGGFPEDEAQAFGVISWGSAVAALSKATKVIVKTPHEAVGIPTKEANAMGLRCTKQVITMLRDQKYASLEVDKEKELIKQETRCILDKCLEIGNGDAAVGCVKGVEAGFIDVPFAPAKANAGKMMPVRDNYGAVRYLEFGNIPFTNEIKEFNKNKLAERSKVENRPVSFQMTVDDIYAISKGHLVGRPN